MIFDSKALQNKVYMSYGNYSEVQMNFLRARRKGETLGADGFGAVLVES